jgi:hypothetical protein
MDPFALWSKGCHAVATTLGNLRELNANKEKAPR